MAIELEIDASTQYATAYRDGKPVATVQRRRVYSDGPVWRAFDLTGAELFHTHFSLSSAALARRIERALAAKAETVQTLPEPVAPAAANPPLQALRNAVNRAIASGSPVIECQPALYILSGRSIDGAVYAIGIEGELIAWTAEKSEASRVPFDVADKWRESRKARNASGDADSAIGRLSIDQA